MEAMLRQSLGKRIICELCTGTHLMGTVYAVEDGLMLISDNGAADADSVAIQHIARFRDVR